MAQIRTGRQVCVAATLGICLLLVAASAADPPASSAPAKARCKLPEPAAQCRTASQPARVDVGVHVLRLTSLDITNNLFSLDFWIWFRWTDDTLKPYESFELVNGKIDSRQVERVDKIDGVNYACLRVGATMTCFWRVERFPLCRQELTLEIEDDDLEADDLVYVVDRENSSVEPSFRASGWVYGGMSCTSLTHNYATNYGDPRRAKGQPTQYSRLIFGYQLARADVFHSFKIFSGLYLSALVAFTVFFVKPDHRLPLIVGAIFAVVASHTVISSYLPEAGVLTLADKLHLVTAGMIVLALFETAYSLHLLHKKQERAYRRLDRITFWVTAPVFVLANIWLLMP
jgi:hypothetical protein